MNADRFDGVEIPITQEFLAQMMGVRRPSVTVATGMLTRAGFIEHRRGKVRIIDRQGLEGSSCECYEIVKREYDRLLPPG
jgi:DNA-binding transcriptional regulator YhcF (GntR family)